MNSECLFIGALLSDSKTVSILSQDTGITREHFQDGRLGEIYHIALGFINRHGSTDRMAVYSHLEANRNDRLLETFASVPSSVTAASSLVAIADMDRHYRRKVIRNAAEMILHEVDETDDPNQCLYSAQSELAKLATTGARKIKTLETDMDAKLDAWRQAKSGSGVVGTRTPWDLVNNCLGGLRPRIMSVLGAYRGTGKSSMSRQIIYGASQHGIPCGLISLEDPSDIAAAHIASMHGMFSPFLLDQGKSSMNIEDVERAWENIKTLPIFIYDHPSTITQIENICASIVAQHQVKLLVIDHIQYILPEKNYKSRNEEVAAYSARLAAIAKRLNCHILVMSQLSRLSEQSNRAPRLSDLRDSGAIEQDARQVLLLYRDPEEKKLDLGGKIWDAYILEIAKNNYGRSGDKVEMIRTHTPVSFEEVSLA